MRKSKKASTPENTRSLQGRKFDVDNFLEYQDSPYLSDTKAETTYHVYGEPMHQSKDSLASQLEINPIDDFLAGEARYSIGNYTLVERSGDYCRVITSPGYCGGYLYTNGGCISVGTQLTSVLAAFPDEIEMDPFGLSYFLNYAPSSNFNLLPFTTMFKHVRRLPAGCHVEFQNGKLLRYQSYLTAPSPRQAPTTFNRAMLEMIAALKRYFHTNPHKKAALMFSGGVDSLIIYLALREAIGAENIRVFTMEHSKSNGPDRALPVAKALGIDLELVTGNLAENESANARLDEMMHQDLITFKAPHLSLIGMDLSDTVVFHGQNFDALANIHMEVLQETQEVGYFSAAGMRIAHTDDRVRRQNKAFMCNLQFTDCYLEDEKLQAQTVDYYASIHKRATPDPEPGRHGMLRGMISSQYPNLLTNADYPMDQVDHLNKEINYFDQYCMAAKNDTRISMDMMRFLTYSQFATKRATTFSLASDTSDTRVSFLAMSGPLVSYYLGKKRNLSVASRPKQEIYAFSRKMSGIPYRSLIKTKHEKHKPSINTQNSREPLLEAHLEKILPANSLVLKAMPNDETAKHIQEIYRKTSTVCAAIGKTRTKAPTSCQLSLGMKLVNLECIMLKAQKIKNDNKIIKE